MNTSTHANFSAPSLPNQISRILRNQSLPTARQFQVASLFLICYLFMITGVRAQSSTCIPGSVENDGTSNWSEECYLSDDCGEQGNPCQANDVVMLGAFIADATGGAIPVCNIGDGVSFYLWGTFHNNTNTNRYAVRSRTEVYKDGIFETEVNECSFDDLLPGNSDVVLLGVFSYQCGQLVQLLNTWVGWSTTAAQCSDPAGENYSSECGHYPPSKCSKELGFIELLAPNFSHACNGLTEGNTEVCFTNLSTGGTGPLVYEWDFGDGNFSTETNPCHTYAGNIGNYVCRLKVTDDKGVVAKAELILNLGELPCCELDIDCPDMFGGIYSCVGDIPIADPHIIRILESCGEVTIDVQETMEGTGCGDDTLLLKRLYIVNDGTHLDSCFQEFWVVDNEIPALTCPESITVQCESLIPDVAEIPTSALDNCSGAATVNLTEELVISPLCENQYAISRTYAALDVCGNVASCVQTITVNDNLLPTIICPADITVSCAGAVPAANPGLVITSDNCGGGTTVTVAPDVTINQTCANEFTILRTYTSTDDCGNAVSCTQTITVDDSTPPGITCPGNVTVSCASNIPLANTAAIVVNDNCGGGVTVSVAADVTINQTCASGFTVIRTYVATDACGNTNSCTQSIFVNDISQPVVTCLPNVTVSCASAIPAPNPGALTTTDNCGGSVNVTVQPDVIINQDCANQFTVLRTYVATDACGNTTLCTQTITVNDITAPTISCSADVTVECAALVPAVNTQAVVTLDNCGGAVTVTHSGDAISAQTCANEYVIIRTYTATDLCGNTATCAQTITVSDNTSPQVTCPVDITVTCAASLPPVSIGTIISSDNCGGSTTVTLAQEVISDQACSNTYTLTRTYLSTDACGNTSTCIQQITVLDDIAPSVTCIADVTVACPGDIPSADVADIIAVDNCAGAVTVTFQGDITSDFVCEGNYVVNRTYVATDACGNTASCTQRIRVLDNIAPVVTCPANVTVSCSADVPQVNVAAVISTDNCGNQVTVTHLGDVSVNVICQNRYTLQRTYVATDECGNSASCLQLITVNDNVAPVITCPAAITVQCAGDIPAVDTVNLAVSDNCGGTLDISHLGDVITNQVCENQFTVTRTYRVIDACGNSATCAQIITVDDTTLPQIQFTAPLLQGVPNGGTIQVQCQGQDPEWDLPDFDENSVAVTDNCGEPLSVDYAIALADQGNCMEDGFINLYRLSWTASDACGNTDSVFVFMSLIDTIAPTITGIPDDVTVNWNEIPELPNVFATDECLCACLILLEETQPEPGCLNGQVITRTWRAKDDCGNVRIESQNITLIDTDGPELDTIENQLAGFIDGSVLEFTCSEGGIPVMFNQLSGSSMDYVDPSGPPTITFDQNMIEANNCEFFGFMEELTSTWVSTDQCGNTSDLTVIARLLDDEAPRIVGLRDTTCVGDPALAEVEALDNCDNASLRHWDVEIQNPCGEGIAIRRTYEAFDNCGNMIRDTSILIPNDQSRPVIEFINPMLSQHTDGTIMQLNCDAIAGQYTSFTTEDVRITDGCMDGVDVVFTETPLAINNCETDGNVSLVELMWTATDPCGNSSSVTITANIVDETAPTFINHERDISIGCRDSVPVTQAIDNCAEVEVVYTDNIIAGPCPYEYDIRRTLVATDPCGNQTTEWQVIHVGKDGPVISGVEEIVCDDITMPAVTAYDECTGESVTVSMTQDTLESTCREGLVVVRTWSATDACNNVTEVTQHIILNDHTAPEILIPTYSMLRKFVDMDTILRIYLSQTDIMNELNALDENSVFATDDCELEITPTFTVQVIPMIEDGIRFERRIYSWIASDACGNATTISFTVDIFDDMPPVIGELPGDITVVCAPLPPAMVVSPDDPTSTVTFLESMEPGAHHGEFIVTRTWTVTDAAGNSTVLVQRIIWIPDTFIECDIELPASVECNSHGVVITSDVTGGFGPYTYEWEINGECFIQSGQNTPAITIYVGWTEVEISLTVTDAYGCYTTCSTIMPCVTSTSGIVSGPLLNSTFVNADQKADPGAFTTDFVNEITNAGLSPNPATNVIGLTFESAADQVLTMEWINFVGQVVRSEKLSAQAGINKTQLDISNLPEGSYLVQITSGSKIYNDIVVITRK